jgi:hypothetical protein
VLALVPGVLPEPDRTVGSVSSGASPRVNRIASRGAALPAMPEDAGQCGSRILRAEGGSVALSTVVLMQICITTTDQSR